MRLILLIQHSSGDVGHIAAGVALSRYIDLVVGNPEDFLKVAKELDKILSNFLLAGGSDFANREACADRLFNPASMLTPSFAK